MSAHLIVIDADDNSGIADNHAYRAYCTDECGWQGEWVRADDFIGMADDMFHAADMAYNEAADQGQDHLDEQGPDPELA